MIVEVEAQLDYETSARAGAGDCFQVIELLDDKGNDITDLVDQGYHYQSIEDLEADLTKALGVPVTVSS